jgi:hypothetical protein
MRAHTITTTRLALLLSLLALGALALVAFGGDSDDQAIAASETETTRDVLALDSTADWRWCGYLGRTEFAVEGVSCRRARRVLDAYNVPRPLPGSWRCYGDAERICVNGAGATIKAWVSCAAWRHSYPRHLRCPPWIKRNAPGVQVPQAPAGLLGRQRRHEQEV